MDSNQFRYYCSLCGFKVSTNAISEPATCAKCGTVTSPPKGLKSSLISLFCIYCGKQNRIDPTYNSKIFTCKFCNTEIDMPANLGQDVLSSEKNVIKNITTPKEAVSTGYIIYKDHQYYCEGCSVLIRCSQKECWSCGVKFVGTKDHSESTLLKKSSDSHQNISEKNPNHTMDSSIKEVDDPQSGMVDKELSMTIQNADKNTIGPNIKQSDETKIKEEPKMVKLKDKVSGVGGWLLWFCIGLTIIGPLMSFSSMYGDWIELTDVFEIVPLFKTALLIENLGFIIITTVGMIIGIKIWSGYPKGKTIAKNYLLFRLTGVIVVELIAIAILRNFSEEVLSSVIEGVIGVFFKEGIIFLIWWTYFKKSKRVRNTYT